MDPDKTPELIQYLKERRLYCHVHAFQYFDGVTRKEELEPIRFELSIRPTEINQGTIQTASAADASGTYSVCKYTVYKNGAKVIDIDQFNQVHEINGVDNAALVRKAMGMM